jgi:citrate synthase
MPNTVSKDYVVSNGLEGIVVAETKLSDVDGEAGHLIIAGYDVEELAPVATFEDAFGLLLHGALPDAAGRARIQQDLAAAREFAFASLERVSNGLNVPNGMDALRGCLGQLSLDSETPESAHAKTAGALAVFAAAWNRVRTKSPLVPPNPKRSQAQDYLAMLTGAAPSAEQTRALDSYLVTVSDHGMNASTFTARVIASTGSDTVSSVVGAIGALKGPLHGGAPGPVLDMLEAIGSPAQAASWLEAELHAGRRIMGMGHRIYRVRDPRAAVMEKAIGRLTSQEKTNDRLALARAVEQAAEGVLRSKYPNRPLHANVEFYTAILLDSVNIPREAFSPTFAVGRVLGWLAHVEEQRATGRLIRPDSRFIGTRRTL